MLRGTLCLACIIFIEYQSLSVTSASPEDSNTQCSAVQTELLEMTSRVSSFEAKYSSLEAKYSSLETKYSSLELKYDIYTEDRQQMFKYFDVISEALKRLMRIEQENALLKQSIHTSENERQEMTQEIENFQQNIVDIKNQQSADCNTTYAILQGMNQTIDGVKNQHKHDNNSIHTILQLLDRRSENYTALVSHCNCDWTVTNGGIIENLNVTISQQLENNDTNVANGSEQRTEGQLNTFQFISKFKKFAGGYEDILNLTVTLLDERNEDCVGNTTKRIKEAILQTSHAQSVVRRDVRNSRYEYMDTLNLMQTVLNKQVEECIVQNEQKMKRAIMYFTKPQSRIFRDCKDVYDHGFKEDGIYWVSPRGNTSYRTYCDISNGGWTVIQRRKYGNVSFDHSWEKYAEGFGDLAGDHWLGLRHLYDLTDDNPSQIHLRFLMNTTQAYATAVYDGFYIEDEVAEFRMHVKSNVSFNTEMQKYVDSEHKFFLYHNNMKFSTKDNGNSAKCAQSCGGGFWYKTCYTIKVNAEFSKMDVWSQKSRFKSVSRSEIKIWRIN